MDKQSLHGVTKIMKPISTISALLFAALFSGCVPAATNHKPVKEPGAVIRVGMTEEAVLERLGEPVLVDPYQVGKYIFYYPKTADADCISDQSSCTPVIFRESRVIGIGREGISRTTTYPSPTATRRNFSPSDTEPRRKIDTGPRREIDAETRREIERLERQVRQIPASRTMDNLRIYRYLHKLDPDNPRYREKVARYEAQYQREEDQREALRREREERRQRQNAVLRKFEGNDRIRIAIENLGNGRFYVWLQYQGDEPIEIAPENFSLTCKNGRHYACYRCRDLALRLAPGGGAEGRISFDTYAEPDELVFSHPATGTIRRLFPEL
jgi:hypothetical protein